MGLTEDDKKYILNEFLNNISGIASKEYQKRVWIKGDGPECDSFTETVCEFFDVANPVLKRFEDYSITKEQAKTLKEFRDAFDKFCDNNDDAEEFINSPEWKEIRDMAKGVLKAFNYKKQ